MRLVVAAMLVLAGGLAAPALASADSGSITNVVAVGGGQAQATYTTTSTTCDEIGYCGWFPEASQVVGGQACDSTPSTDLIYVGDFQATSGTKTETDTFYPLAASVRLCLYIFGPDFVEHLVAQSDYSTPPAQPSPTPTPTPSPTPPPKTTTPPLTIREAKATLLPILRREYRSRFKHRRHFRRSCYRYTVQKVRCKVRWESGHFRYRGSVTMRNDPGDPSSILYRKRIHRTRLHSKPKPTRAPSRPRRACDPNYGGCLNPYASDYDCLGGSGNGPYYTGSVRVIGDDHFGLDRNHDGIGCND